MGAIIKVDTDLIEEIDDIKKFINNKRPFSLPTLKLLNTALNTAYATHNVLEKNNPKETNIVLEGMTVRGKSVKEHLRDIDCVDAIHFLGDLVNKKNSISEWNIKGVHQLVLKNIDNENAGRYRTCNVTVEGAIHTPPEFIIVPDLMQQLIKDYKSWNEYHPIVKASLLHGELVKIHPFVDGNGRTCRLLMNLDIMKSGYSPIIIKKEDRNNYYDSLDKAHTTNDYTDFINLATVSELEMLKRYLSVIDNSNNSLEKIKTYKKTY